MNKFDDMRQILERYSLDVDLHLSIDTTCIICKELLIEACRGNCGCRYCKQCIKQYLIEGEKCCPGETDECRNGSLSLSINVKDDIATDEIIEKLSVKCPLKDCEYQGQIIDMHDHLKISHCNEENNDNTTDKTSTRVKKHNDFEINPVFNHSNTRTTNEDENVKEPDEKIKEKLENLTKEFKDLTDQYEMLTTTMTERSETTERETVIFKEEMNKCQQTILAIRNKIENDENQKEVDKEKEREDICSLQRKCDDLFNAIAEVKEFNESQVSMLIDRTVKDEIETQEIREKILEENMKEESYHAKVQMEITDLKTKYDELINLVTELKISYEKQSVMSDEEKVKNRTEVTEIREQHAKEMTELKEMLREIQERVTGESVNKNQNSNQMKNSINDIEETESFLNQLNIDPANLATNDRVTNIASFNWDIGKFSRLKRTKTCIQSDYFLSSNSEYQMSLWLYPNWSENVTDPHIRIVLGIRSGVGDVKSRWPIKSIIYISIKNKFAPDFQKRLSKNRIFEQPNSEVFDFFIDELKPAHVLDNNSLLIECEVRIDE